MRSSSLFTWFIMLLLAAPALARAQAPGERMVLMTRYDVDVEDDAAFRNYLAGRVRAAREAGLPAERGWTTLRTDNTWLVLQHIGSLAEVEGFDALEGQVRGSPGETILKSAEASLSGVNYSAETRVIAGPAAWRHQPSTQLPPNFAFVQEFRVRPGAGEAFNRYRDGFIAFLRQISLPYRYEAFRPVLGANAVVGIVWPDDLVRYYSEFSPAVFTRRYPEQFAPLSAGLRANIHDMDTTLYSVMHEYSYQPSAGPPAKSSAAASRGGAIIPPKGGDALKFCDTPELRVTVKVGEAQGAETMTMGTAQLAPGKSNFGTHKVDEIVYFLKGRGRATVGETRQPIAAGATMYIPRGVRHGFENTGRDWVEFVWVSSPTGFERGIRTVGVPLSSACPAAR